MVSVRCTSSTHRGTPERKGRSSSPTKIAALTFSSDGTRAAYAVCRSSALPPDGVEDPAHGIYVVKTREAAADGAASQSSSSTNGTSVAPFTSWSLVQALVGVHTAPVTALAWCGSSGALVSASADRCAYVWAPYHQDQQDSNNAATSPHGVLPSFTAVPQLVMLGAEVLRSPTAVAWSAEGSKVYIGTAGGTVAVGRYDRVQRWWLCRVLLNASVATPAQPQQQPQDIAELHVPGYEREAANAAAKVPLPAPAPPTTSDANFFEAAKGHLVVSLVPHPVDNTRVAVALLNGAVWVLSTHTKSVDGALPTTAPAVAPGEPSALCDAIPFGAVCFSCRISCWLHGLAWSSSGEQLAVVGQDSTLHVWQRLSQRSRAHTSRRLRVLPLLCCVFHSEQALMAAGFDGSLYVFSAEGESEWRVVGEGRRTAEASAVAATAAPDVPSAAKRAFVFFERGGAAAATAVAPITKAAHVNRNTVCVAQTGCGTAAQGGRHVSTPPLRLLFHVPQVGPESAATFVSVSGDGSVQVWCVDNIE